MYKSMPKYAKKIKISKQYLNKKICENADKSRKICDFSCRI